MKFLCRVDFWRFHSKIPAIIPLTIEERTYVQKENKYDGTEIKILEGALRPFVSVQVYNFASGLPSPVWEIVDNQSMRQWLNSKVTVHNSIAEDNGRGIPVDLLILEKDSNLEVVLTKRHEKQPRPLCLALSRKMVC